MISDIPPPDYNSLNFYNIVVKDGDTWNPTAWVPILTFPYTGWDLSQVS